MTVPYDRIKSRVNLYDVPCAMCAAITVMPAIDHCHAHGLTRGVLCMQCNNRMARVDADLALATPDELFYRDNCPDCRAGRPAGMTWRFGRRTNAQVRPVVGVYPPADLAADLHTLDAHHPGDWPPISRAQAVARVDAVVPGRTAAHVAALLAGKGIAVEVANVRTIRYLARKAQRQQSPVNSTSEFHGGRPVGDAATSENAESATAPGSEIQSEIEADPDPSRSPR